MNMNNTELRIGNWVNFQDDDTQFIVTTIDDLGIGVKNDTDETWIELDRFAGITITPDVLLKCGAEKIDTDYQYKIRINAISILFRFNAGHVYSELGGIYMGSQITYLHQLQNLKHAMCGQGITYKP